MTIVEVIEKFGNQQSCYEHLEMVRWGGIPLCPYCGASNSSKKAGSNRHLCHQCNNSFSVLVGTVMESTKLPLNKWFVAIVLIVNAKKGISSLQLSRDIGVNKNTALYLQKRIRWAMSSLDNFLSGIVEVDESYVGGSLTNKHKADKEKNNMDKCGMTHRQVVLGMLQRPNKVVAIKIEKADSATIRPILKDYIDGESTVVTDGFGAYRNLHNSHSKHVVLNHSKDEYTKGIYNTSRLDNFWMMAKRAIVGQYHKISDKHLQLYLNELSFKANNRGKDLFDLLINNVMNPKYAFC